MVTSDFTPEVEIRPFRACAMKNTQYNAYLWPNRRSFRVFKEVGVEKHEGDVTCKSGSGNMAVSWMRNATIIGTVRSWWTWLSGRYHVPQNLFLVKFKFYISF